MSDAVPASARYFVGLPLEPGWAAALDPAPRRFGTHVRRIADEQHHVPLQAAGFLTPERLTAVRAALGQVLARRFALRLRGVGHHHVPADATHLWAGLVHDERLRYLHALVGRTLEAAGCPADGRPLAAHVPVALATPRLERPDLDDWQRSHDGFRAELPVDRFELYRGTWSPAAGPGFAREQAYPLA